MAKRRINYEIIKRAITFKSLEKALNLGNPTMNVWLPFFREDKTVEEVTVLVHENSLKVREMVIDWLWDTYLTEGEDGIEDRLFEDYEGKFPEIRNRIMVFSIRR